MARWRERRAEPPAWQRCPPDAWPGGPGRWAAEAGAWCDAHPDDYGAWVTLISTPLRLEDGYGPVA